MAITNDVYVKNLLKVWYKDGVMNLLARHSSALGEIPFTRVEGKAQNFSALYSRGGGVSADLTVAEDNAKTQRNAEFSVEPGKIFSVYYYNASEVQASLTKKGAYMKVAGNKFFAATTSARQTLAASLYGRGYGEVGIFEAGDTLTGGQESTITLSEDAIIKLDIGSAIAFKASVGTATVLANAVVTAVNDNSITILPTITAGSTVTIPANSIVALQGSVDATGPRMPLGLDAWLPVIKGRDGTDSDWTGYIGTAFCGVNRSVAPSRLAGNFYVPSASEDKYVTIQKAIRKSRHNGGEPDFIIMNDEDFLALTQELYTQNRTVTASTSKAKKVENIGVSAITASFSTNFVENIIDDPFCPKGKFYVLEKKALEYFIYTNEDKIVNDGVSGNDAGKVDDISDIDGEQENYKLLIDDVLTVQPGPSLADGPSVEAILQIYGSLAVTNPSVCTVGLFYNANGYNGVLGYLA